ncbi:hypothetical protein PVAG01_04886 [Phlyctema vagabunda]|uniref:Mif2/CENP-C cupin domain-containing protein n=1 Tax=Phlyctema vagabunda TaxID=108571 RepID=A0ABR4PIH0_9HELO
MGKRALVSEEESDAITDRLNTSLEHQRKKKRHKKHIKSAEKDERRKQRKLEKDMKKQARRVEDGSESKARGSSPLQESETNESPTKPPTAPQLSGLGFNADALMATILKGRSIQDTGTELDADGVMETPDGYESSSILSPTVDKTARESRKQASKAGEAALANRTFEGKCAESELGLPRGVSFTGAHSVEDFWDDEPLMKKLERLHGSKHKKLAKASRGSQSTEVSKPEFESEAWEASPGRYRGIVKMDDVPDNDEEIEENLAFSAQYISDRSKGVTVFGVNFGFHVVDPDQAHVFEPQKDVFRICSVAKGKLHVTVGNQRFAVCANGIWRIKAKEKCMARNLESTDAVIHIMSV